MNIFVSLCFLLFLSGCANISNQKKKQSDMDCLQVTDSEYQKRWPGLFEKRNGEIVAASQEDIDVAQGYPEWEEKGPWEACRRITIMCAKRQYKIEEEIRIIHVFDNIAKNGQVYVMGPKKVYGEYLDDKIIHALPKGENYFEPANYNGITLPTPALDYNYEITTYQFKKPGIHTIYWQIETLKSNVLSLEIVP